MFNNFLNTQFLHNFYNLVDDTEQVNSTPAINAGDKKHPTGKPPQSAIDACTNKPVKTQCEFIGPRETKTGFCEMTPDEQYFACNPTRKKQ